MYSIFLFKLLKIPRAGARGLLRNLGPSQAENPKLLLLNSKSYRAYTFAGMSARKIMKLLYLHRPETSASRN